jgi:CPA2 family monovalent cation:H+ antiporter-2
VRELFDSAVRAGKYALAALGHDDDEIDEVADEFVRHDRHMLAELATLWDPAIPSERNPAYLAKAREQHAEIEAELRRRVASRAEARGAAAAMEPGPEEQT